MSNTVDISVIIPAYNSEKTLGRLLRSVKKQDFSNYEVLIINDGSKDNTQKVIDDLCAGDNRIKGFIKENGGVSSARNMGLDHAVGKYITFYDADDTIPPGSMKALFDVAEVQNADLVVGGKRNKTLTRKRRGGKSLRFAEKSEIEKYDPEFAYSFSLCDKLFRKDIIDREGIRFEPFNDGEDGLFVFTYLQYCNKIAGCYKIVYEWRKRLFYEGTSLSQVRTKEGILDSLEAFGRIKSIHDSMLNNDGIAEDDPRRKAFDDAFYFRVANTTALNHFYRYLWLNEDAAVELALRGLDDCKNKMSEEMLSLLRERNSDLDLDNLLSKEKIIRDPVLIVIISREACDSNLNMMLDSLYEQQFPYFSVYIPADRLALVREDHLTKGNIVKYDGSHIRLMGRIIAENRSEYLMLVDEEMYFGQMTLRTMIALMRENRKADMVMVEPYTLDITKRKGCNIDILHDLYDKNLSDESFNTSEERWFDCFHVNKLVRTESLRSGAKKRAFLQLNWNKLGTLVKIIRASQRDWVFVGATEEDVLQRYDRFTSRFHRKFM